MQSVQGFKEVPTYELEILVAVSAAIETIIFCYHFSTFNCKYENPKWIDCFRLSLLIFFILAILITTLGYRWATIDLRMSRLDNAQNMIYYIGICGLYIGNALFIWFEYYLHFGIQSPWIDNDIRMHRLKVNVIELKTKMIDDVIKDECVMNKILIRSGPFACCRHPIIPILLIWQIGYGLATGAWFEFIALLSFIAVQLLYIISIESSLLYHFGKEYYEWMETKNAFCPTILCGKLCEMGLFNQYCICLCRFGNCKTSRSIIPSKVHSFPHVDSVVLMHRKKMMKPSYGSVINKTINE